MLVLCVAILLALTSVATFPCWSYSARWGHLPSAIAGTLLLCVAMIAVGARSGPKTADAERELASAPPVTSAHNAFHRTVETVSIEPEKAFQ